MVAQDAAPSAAKSAPRAEGIDAELDTAHVTWLPAGAALLLLKTGQMLLASLEADGGVVRRIQARLGLTSEVGHQCFDVIHSRPVRVQDGRWYRRPSSSPGIICGHGAV